MSKHFIPAHTEIYCDLCGQNAIPISANRYVQFKYYKVFGKKGRGPKKIYICDACWNELEDRCRHIRYMESTRKKKDE